MRWLRSKTMGPSVLSRDADFSEGFFRVKAEKIQEPTELEKVCKQFRFLIGDLKPLAATAPVSKNV